MSSEMSSQKGSERKVDKRSAEDVNKADSNVNNIFRSLTQEDVSRRTSRQWGTYPHGVIPLSVAQMDVPVAPGVRSALHGLMKTGDFGYLSRQDGQEYLNAYARFAYRRWGARVDVREARVFSDVISALRAVIVRTLGHRIQLDPSITNQGERAKYEGTVVTFTPVYPQFLNRLSAGYELRTLNYLPNQHPDLDGLDRLLGQIARRGTRAASPTGYDCVLLLCSPNNPTGTMLTRSEMIRIAQICERWNVRMIVDEIYSPLERISRSALEDARDRGFEEEKSTNDDGIPDIPNYAEDRVDDDEDENGQQDESAQNESAREEAAEEKIRLSLLNEPGVIGSDISLANLGHTITTPYHFIPMLSLPQAQSAIVAFSASKTFSIPSFRSCLLMAGEDPRCQDLIHDLTRLEVEDGSHVDAVIAATALNDSDQTDRWLDDVACGLQENEGILREAIAEKIPRARLVIGPASFLAWIDFSSYFAHTDADRNAAAAILEHSQVALAPGDGFGERQWGNWARLNFAMNPQILMEAVDRMARYLRQL
jgi:bifunctional pyridoxal-dependent enzyme with beta-cystathionase and maltose regulon repressor activities